MLTKFESSSNSENGRSKTHRKLPYLSKEYELFYQRSIKYAVIGNYDDLSDSLRQFCVAFRSTACERNASKHTEGEQAVAELSHTEATAGFRNHPDRGSTPPACITGIRSTFDRIARVPLPGVDHLPIFYTGPKDTIEGRQHIISSAVNLS